MKQVKTEDLPDDFRQMEVKSNPDLGVEEQETSISFVKDTEDMHIYSDIPTFVKWVLSVDDADICWVHLDSDDDAICGCKAKIPKGVMRLKQAPRQTNNHYSMAGYGNARD